jgi:uncharacterized protein (TIGR02246 family)
MKRMVVITSMVALALAGCQQYGAKDKGASDAAAINGASEAGDATAAVAAVEADMLAAFKAKDAAKLTSHYAADAVLAVPERTVKGVDAIAKANADDLKDPAFALDFTNERTDVSGDLAYTSGSFKVTYTDTETKKAVNGQGTYVTVFKKQADGSWKVVADIATPTAG